MEKPAAAYSTLVAKVLGASFSSSSYAPLHKVILLGLPLFPVHGNALPVRDTQLIKEI
jgi:hypothetical protein